MKRSSAYESAFEAYLQWHRLCYVAVHEGRRTFLGESRIKNLDFIVHGMGGLGLLVDVKGRRYPGGTAEKPKRVWECWSTEDDIEGLQKWAEVFGEHYWGLLVFVYALGVDETVSDELRDVGDLFIWRGQRFLFRAVTVEDYRTRLRQRSPRWRTVGLSSEDFRDVAKPFHYFAHEFNPLAQECPL